MRIRSARETQGFTGIDDPYEAPENPKVAVDTSKHSPQEAAIILVDLLVKHGKIAALGA